MSQSGEIFSSCITTIQAHETVSLKYTALVAGITGTAGSHILSACTSRGDWDFYGLSRKSDLGVEFGVTGYAGADRLNFDTFVDEPNRNRRFAHPSFAAGS